MENLTITDFDTEDGVRAVKTSKQALLTSAAADTVFRLTILARILAAAGTPGDAQGTGNGTATLFTLVSGSVPKVGTYLFTLTAALIGKITDPDGNDIAADIALTDGDATVVSAGGLQFTITDGSTAFVAGDYFELPVTAGSGNYVYYDPAGGGGADVPVAVSLSEVVAAAAGNNAVGVLLEGKVREDKLIIDGSAAGVGITDAIKDSLRTYGIIVEPATQTAALDNV